MPNMEKVSLKGKRQTQTYIHTHMTHTYTRTHDNLTAQVSLFHYKPKYFSMNKETDKGVDKYKKYSGAVKCDKHYVS